MTRAERFFLWSSAVVLASVSGEPASPVNAVGGSARARIDLRHTVDVPKASSRGAIVDHDGRAQELSPYGITVNAIAPSLFPISPDALPQWEGYGPEGKKRVLDGLALRRLGTAGDIAKAVTFFVSGLAEYVTGQVLPVHGGSF